MFRCVSTKFYHTGFSFLLSLQDERLMSWMIIFLLLALVVKMRYKVKRGEWILFYHSCELASQFSIKTIFACAFAVIHCTYMSALTPLPGISNIFLIFVMFCCRVSVSYEVNRSTAHYNVCLRSTDKAFLWPEAHQWHHHQRRSHNGK